METSPDILDNFWICQELLYVNTKKAAFLHQLFQLTDFDCLFDTVFFFSQEL